MIRLKETGFFIAKESMKMTPKYKMWTMKCRVLLPLLLVAGVSRAARADEAAEVDDSSSVTEDATTATAGNLEEGADKGGGETDAAENQKGRKWGGRLRDHAKQGFVNILAGTGYYLVVPYDKDNPNKMCARDEENTEEGRAYCSARVGWHLDFLGGYAFKPGFELFLMFRLGLERPDSNGLINQPKTRQLGLGVKVFTPKDGFFKLGIGIAPLVDFSDRGAAGIRPDLVIHVPIQALFDIFPWFGAYAQIAPNFSFIAEFKVEFTGGIGVQGRFP